MRAIERKKAARSLREGTSECTRHPEAGEVTAEMLL